MQQAFVELNKVRTKILTWGRWIEESQQGTNEVVILIVGNPGTVGFYETFGKTLYQQSNIPVWCVGHAGHNFPTENSFTKLPKFSDNKELYSLQGQIEHKVDFFRKYVPENAQVNLIGHSVGAYMALEILEHPEVKTKIKDVFLIFPAIEHIAKTKNGKFLNTFIRPIVWFVVFLTWIFTNLPDCLATFLLYIYMFIANIPRQLHVENIKQFLKPGIVKRVLFLGIEEMDFVEERNNDVIRRNVKKVKFCYGQSDNWTEPACWENLKADIPEVNCEVSSFEHAFVFNQSTEVACKLADWLKK